MPSIKKRVTGFIRQLSAPNGAAPAYESARSATKSPKLQQQQPDGTSTGSSNNAEGFIQKYLNG